MGTIARPKSRTAFPPFKTTKNKWGLMDDLQPAAARFHAADRKP